MSISHEKSQLAAVVGSAALSLAFTALFAAGFLGATAQDPAQRYQQVARQFTQQGATVVRIVAAPAPAAAIRTLS